MLQALSWTFYELLRHPDIEAKLMEEIQAVLGTGAAAAAAQPSYEQVRQLRYARACFMEALRLHPSVPQVRTARCAQASCKIATWCHGMARVSCY